MLALKNWPDGLDAGVPKLYRRENDGRLSSGERLNRGWSFGSRIRQSKLSGLRQPCFSALRLLRSLIPRGVEEYLVSKNGKRAAVQNLSHIWSRDGFGLRDLRLIERPHAHVASNFEVCCLLPVERISVTVKFGAILRPGPYWSPPLCRADLVCRLRSTKVRLRPSRPAPSRYQ